MTCGEPDGSIERFEDEIAASIDALATSHAEFPHRGRPEIRLVPYAVKDECFYVKQGEVSYVEVPVYAPVYALGEMPNSAGASTPHSPAWLRRVLPDRLTGLAVFIAGRKRAAVGAEWRSHLSGENGVGLPSRRQAREAAGFVLAAVRYRIQDFTDLAWRPVDALLASREMSSLTVVLATLIIVVFFLRRGGVNDLADHLDSVAVVLAFALAAIHRGRQYRRVKPPKRKPRRR